MKNKLMTGLAVSAILVFAPACDDDLVNKIAEDLQAQIDSTCNSIFPCTVAVTGTPPSDTHSRSATIKFSSPSTATASFTCQHNDGEKAACTSPHTLERLASGTHTVTISPLDAAGKAGLSASVSWTISIPLVINEFVTSSDTSYEDPDAPGEYPDWVEIYNPTTSTIDMGGMYLGDDAEDITASVVPDGVMIEGGEYLVFLFDKEPDLGPLHIEAKLSQDDGDEDVILADIDATTIIDLVSDYPLIATDHSYARIPDGTGDFQLDTTPVTPGAEN